ncbi:hypothetical protein D3C85_1874520 [compost metagenome]
MFLQGERAPFADVAAPGQLHALLADPPQDAVADVLALAEAGNPLACGGEFVFVTQASVECMDEAA